MSERENESGSEGAPSESRAFPPKWPRIAGVTAVTDVLFAVVIAALAANSFGAIAGSTYGPGNVELFSARRVEVMGLLALANAAMSGLATHRFLSERSYLARSLAVISLGACLVFAGFILLDALITAGQMPGGDWAALNAFYPLAAAVVIAPLCVSGLLHLTALSRLGEFAGPKPNWPFAPMATLAIAIGLGLVNAALGFGAWQIHAKEMRGVAERWAQRQEENAKARALSDRIASGGATREELVETLGVSHIQLRDEAMAKLAATGPIEAAAFPSLAEILVDGYDGNAECAALLLGSAGEPALPVLLELLRHEEAPVRARAALGLGGMGSTAAPSVPELLRLLGDEDESVRGAARTALDWIDPGSLPAAEAPEVSFNVKRVSVAADGMQGNGASRYPAVSADGRVVAFYSEASNLVPGDEEGRRDIFVRDLASGSLERIPAADASYEVHYEKQGPALSADGRFVAFASSALRLIPRSAWRGRKANVRRRKGISNIFVCDRETGEIEWVPVPEEVNPAEAGRRSPSISADGRFVAFLTGEGRSVYDRQTKAFEHAASGATFTNRVGQGEVPAISSHGLGVFDGALAGGRRIGSERPSISDDGSVVAFASRDFFLVPGDTNWVEDVFLVTMERAP